MRVALDVYYVVFLSRCNNWSVALLVVVVVVVVVVLARPLTLMLFTDALHR